MIPEMARPLMLDSRIVVTMHADHRLHERAPELDLDAARTEIHAAIDAGRYLQQGGRFWLAWTEGGRRAYSFAWYPLADPARIIVLTVLLDYERCAA